MNKNPDRPKEINKIISRCLNSKSEKNLTDEEKYKLNQKKLLKGIFEE